MHSTSSFAEMQLAATLIEKYGTEAFYSAKDVVGWEVATALLIAHLRRTFGSDKRLFAQPEIDAKVAELLKETLPADYFTTLEHGRGLYYMGTLYALHNFSAFTVYYRNRLWPTLEHAWQADKFFKSTDPDKEEHPEENDGSILRIHNAPSAHEAKGIAHEELLRMNQRERSNEEKEKTMRKLIRLKFDQHWYVRKTLVKTREMKLVEDSPVDSFWGRGPEWSGKNLHGRLWEELRVEKFGS